MLRSLALMMAMLPMLPLALARPFVGVLLQAWISFMDPQHLIYGFAADLPWAQISFAATIIGCFVAREPKRLRLDASGWLIVLFMICISLTCLTALAPEAMVEVKWEAVMKMYLFVLIAGILLTDRSRIHALLWAMVISLGFYGVRGGLFTIMTGGSNRVYGPPDSMISDNNHIAVALLVTLPLMNFLRLQSPHRSVRIALAIAMMLTFIAVLGSYSRGAFLALGVGALFIWWNSSRKLLFGPLLVVGIASGLALMPSAWTARMATIDNYQHDASAEGRLGIWGASWQIALARPLTGGGFMAPYVQSIVDEFDPGVRARAVHSIYFEVIGEHGFPAFLIWIAINLTGIANTIRVRKLSRLKPELEWCNDLAKMGQVSIIVYLVGGAFLSLSYWDYYFTLLAILAATCRLAMAETRVPRPALRRQPTLTAAAVALPNTPAERLASSAS